MFAYAVCVEPQVSHKRKSVFADDGQPWPPAAFKRPCLNPVGRDQTQAEFGLSVPCQSYVWAPCSAPAGARIFVAGGVPMQRIVAPSLVAYAQPSAPHTPSTSPTAGPHGGHRLRRFGYMRDVDDVDLRALRISYRHIPEARPR